MIAVTKEPTILVKDLKEGDIAKIDYYGNTHIVYVFKDTNIRSPLGMVSLSHKQTAWNDIKENTCKVIQVFTTGDMLCID